ncbi:DegV family protein [Konateibacter massiliensis]|uniref:DegV family protein n=1 Tax=Konateibacter massiliensis TaxID=2002841 RepID=UPI000C15EE1E|nr:DegV family protein [Konateibacter massiliensis]
MNRVAVITDSNSGITQAEAKELGIFVLPMPFTIDGAEYFEDINLTVGEFYEKLEADADISTSQPSIESITDLWDKLLEEYDEIVHIPMSSGLSGSCSTATVLAQDYENKVEVVNNQRISVTQRQSVLDALELTKRGKSAVEIKEILEKNKFESSIYIMVDTLKYLKKGGRITPAAAALGTVLRLKPVLQIQGEKLEAFAKAKTVKQAKSIMMNAIHDDIENRFGGVEAMDVTLFVVHSSNEEAASKLKEELEQEYPGMPVFVDDLSLSVSCHIGAGSLAIAVTRNLQELK